MRIVSSLCKRLSIYKSVKLITYCYKILITVFVNKLMAKTSTERSQEFRKKIKLDPEKLSKERAKERLRWKQRSIIAKIQSKTPEDLSIQREKERLRKAKWRKNKLEKSKQEASTSCSPTELEKAASRIKYELPKESEKKVAVIASVIADLSAAEKDKLYSSSELSHCVKHKKICNVISDEIVKEVQLFFERDDVSRMCRGQTDVIIRDNQAETQKRILQMTIREAYSLFCETSHIKIGIISFQNLRPKHVLPVTEKYRELPYEHLQVAVDPNICKLVHLQQNTPEPSNISSPDVENIDVQSTTIKAEPLSDCETSQLCDLGDSSGDSYSHSQNGTLEVVIKQEKEDSEVLEDWKTFRVAR